MTEREVLLYLHGHGSDATEAAARIQRIDPDRRRLAASIDAPIDLGHGAGRSWFETTTSGVVTSDVERAVGHVVAVIAAWRAEDPRIAVVLGGFSQGAAIAAGAAAADRRNVAALVLHCGFLPDGMTLDGLDGVPTLSCRAADDETVPDFFSDALTDQLRVAGAVVEEASVPGGHEFSDTMAQRTATFLTALDDRG